MIIISLLFAYIMLVQPHIFHNVPPEVYDDIPSQIFDPFITGILMIACVVVKVSGRILHNGIIRLVGLCGLNILWAITFVSLLYRFLNGSQSATFLLSLAMVLVGIGQALRGNYRGVAGGDS